MSSKHAFSPLEIALFVFLERQGRDRHHGKMFEIDFDETFGVHSLECGESFGPRKSEIPFFNLEIS